MIAYCREWLNNLAVQDELKHAYQAHHITHDEYDAIRKRYPAGFYTPNIFMRIGLLLLTLIILLFSFGLLSLILNDTIDSSWGLLTVFFALITYVSLEYMTRAKHHYRSGVDDGLLWGASLFLFGGIMFTYEPGSLVTCMIIFSISFYGSLRYTDRVMATIAFVSLAGFFFYSCSEGGTAGKAMVPFVIMILSLFTYLGIKKLQAKSGLAPYVHCMKMIEVTSLIVLYAAGNYFVVRELSNRMFHLRLEPGESIPFGWLFWIFTLVIPIIYLARGMQKKDRVLLRAGMILMAAIVFTVRYYHTFLPVELMMTLGGIALLLIAYILTRYLHEPKFGFTYKELNGNKQDELQLEALILAQTFKQDTDAEGYKFGGGSFGGGGASGEY